MHSCPPWRFEDHRQHSQRTWCQGETKPLWKTTISLPTPRIAFSWRDCVCTTSIHWGSLKDIMYIARLTSGIFYYEFFYYYYTVSWLNQVYCHIQPKSGKGNWYVTMYITNKDWLDQMLHSFGYCNYSRKFIPVAVLIFRYESRWKGLKDLLIILHVCFRLITEQSLQWTPIASSCLEKWVQAVDIRHWTKVSNQIVWHAFCLHVAHRPLYFASVNFFQVAQCRQESTAFLTVCPGNISQTKLWSRPITEKS